MSAILADNGSQQSVFIGSPDFWQSHYYDQRPCVPLGFTCVIDDRPAPQWHPEPTMPWVPAVIVTPPVAPPVAVPEPGTAVDVCIGLMAGIVFALAWRRRS